ncbi:hypothetical protein EDC27_0045 [Desulfosoma caldarium]|uniref:Uncharacterized protein n=1 Tax=Desulfosoma caldarium TaxID=610254 RepID=A0A3N1VR11_9BACT|nr:hypothetical protein EDC27_0045 [Desulfosoma caldarium]
MEGLTARKGGFGVIQRSVLSTAVTNLQTRHPHASRIQGYNPPIPFPEFTKRREPRNPLNLKGREGRWSSMEIC